MFTHPASQGGDQGENGDDEQDLEQSTYAPPRPVDVGLHASSSGRSRGREGSGVLDDREGLEREDFDREEDEKVLHSGLQGRASGSSRHHMVLEVQVRMWDVCQPQSRSVCVRAFGHKVVCVCVVRVSDWIQMVLIHHASFTNNTGGLKCSRAYHA